MAIFKKRRSSVDRAARKDGKRLRELIRSCERVYGVSLSFKSAEELSLWLMKRDPYMAELICEA